MNLTKLFEMQKVLDDRIVREKGLEGKYLLPMKILALQVELGELANEWRGFKVWSNDREMRRDKALVEYVDCLHFILSIGLDLGIKDDVIISPIQTDDIVRRFILLMRVTTDIDIDIRDEQGITFSKSRWQSLVCWFIGLGVSLGFTWEEVEQAYFAKNAVNHERQATGY